MVNAQHWIDNVIGFGDMAVWQLTSNAMTNSTQKVLLMDTVAKTQIVTTKNASLSMYIEGLKGKDVRHFCRLLFLLCLRPLYTKCLCPNFFFKSIKTLTLISFFVQQKPNPVYLRIQECEMWFIAMQRR